MTSGHMKTVTIVLSLTVYEIFAKQGKCQNFYLENESQYQGIEERDLRHSTRNVRIHISDFNYLANIHLHKKVKHIQTSVMTIGKIYRTDVPKKEPQQWQKLQQQVQQQQRQLKLYTTSVNLQQ